MAKKSKRYIPLVLVPFVAVNLYAGCKKIDGEIINNKKEDNLPNYAVVSDVGMDIYAENNEQYQVKADTLVKEQDPFDYLNSIYNSSGKSINKILNTEDINSPLYASALLMKLRNANLDDELIKNELNNILLCGSVATDLDELTWGLLFGNLEKTIMPKQNVVGYYYPLAKYVHLYDCELDHEYTDIGDGRITCDDIQDRLMTLNEGMLFYDYAINEVFMYGNEKAQNGMKRILKSGMDLDIAFKELDNVYLYAIIPRCMDELEYEICFGNLMRTCGKYENCYEVYYDLACLVHELSCDNDHYENEYYTVECEPYRLKLEKGEK